MQPINRTILLADYKPHPRNYNRHPDNQIAHIMASLQKFGQPRSIVVWRGYFIAGHGVAEAAGRLGWQSLRADVLPDDYPEHLALAYIAADNELGRQSDPDEAALAAILNDTAREDRALLDAIGYTDKEFAELLNKVTPTNAGSDTEPQIDKAEELRQKWGVESGQLWQLGQHRLICGDCTDKATVERLMGGEKADITFTSPPYNLGDNVSLSTRNKKNNAYNDYDDSNDDYLNLLVSFTEIALLVSRYVLVNIQSLAGNKKDLIRYLFHFIDCFADVAVWTKSNPQPAMANNVMDSAFEFIYFFSSFGNPTRAIDTGSFRGLVSNVVDGKVNSENIIPGSHSATFPVYLPEYFVKNFSSAASVIYDPFLGSGTTLIAAHNLNRRCFGAEISPAYCGVILQRWADHTGGQPELLQ